MAWFGSNRRGNVRLRAVRPLSEVRSHRSKVSGSSLASLNAQPAYRHVNAPGSSEAARRAKWIVSLRVFAHQAKLELLVPTVVIDEFKRNRARIETSMTASVSERFRLIKRDLDEYGGEDQQRALDVLEGLAHQVPLIGAMTTRNFDDILSLLESGQSIEPTDQQRLRVVQRGLEKSAPFHRSRNSVLPGKAAGPRIWGLRCGAEEIRTPDPLDAKDGHPATSIPSRPAHEPAEAPLNPDQARRSRVRSAPSHLRKSPVLSPAVPCHGEPSRDVPSKQQMSNRAS